MRWRWYMLAIPAVVAACSAFWVYWFRDYNPYVIATGFAGFAVLFIYAVSDTCEGCKNKGTMRTVASETLREEYETVMRERTTTAINTSGRSGMVHIRVPVTVRKTLVELTRECSACKHRQLKQVWRKADT